MYPLSWLEDISKLLSSFVLFVIGNGLIGCSSIGYWNTLNPAIGEKWEITNQRAKVEFILFATPSDFYKNNPIRDGASYECSSSRIQVYSIGGYSFGFVGPPIVPVIPIWDNGATFIKLELIDPSLWGSACPTIIASTEKKLTLKLVSKTFDRPTNTYDCGYTIPSDMSSAEQLTLSISHKDCNISPILYRKKTYWGYCMFCIPG